MVRSGDVLIVGGFGMTGSPGPTCLHRAGRNGPLGDLTYVGNNVGEPGIGRRAVLLRKRSNPQDDRLVLHPATQKWVQAALTGEIEVELLPQGTPRRGNPSRRGPDWVVSSPPPERGTRLGGGQGITCDRRSRDDLCPSDPW